MNEGKNETFDVFLGNEGRFRHDKEPQLKDI